jgi:Tfp pilus assembly protein PilO
MANPTVAAESPKTDAVPAQAEGQAEQPAKKKANLLAFFSKLSPREKMIAGALGFVLVIFVLNLVMFQPLGRHLDKLSKTIRQKEELIPKKLAILNDREQIEKVHADLGAYLTDSKISSEEEIAAYLGEIERVSQSVGLFISNINPVQTEELDNGYWLKVDLEGAGSMANIKKFVATLENSNPAMRVSAMNLRSQGATSEELRFRFSVVKLGLKNPA